MKAPERLSDGQLIKLHDFYLGHVDQHDQNQLVMDTIAALKELIERRAQDFYAAHAPADPENAAAAPEGPGHPNL